MTVLALLAAADFASAGTKGRLAGSIIDQQSRQPLRGATIAVVEAGVYGVSDKYGDFIINDLQPGAYEVQIKFIGYATMTYKRVYIKTDVTTPLNVELEPTVIATDPIIITGERTPIREEVTSTVHHIDGDDVNSGLPVDNFMDGFNYLPGIFSNHFRGGRTGEVLYMVDGIPIVSALTRELAYDIPTSAIEEIVVYNGAFGAEYGNANAGIVNIIRKRARNQLDYTAKMYTDFFGFSKVPHDNNRRVQVGFGGPVTMSFGGPVLETNYYISLDFNATDTPKREVFRKAFDETIQNNFNGSFVYDAKLSKNLNFFLQTAFSRWSWREIEEGNNDPIQTLPIRKNNHLNTTIGLTHTVTPSMFYRITLGYNRLRDSIAGDVPDSLETVITSDDPVPTNALALEKSPWEQRAREDIYYLKLDIFKQFRQFLQFKAGVGAEYYDLALDAERFVKQPNRLGQDADEKYAYHKFVNDFREFPYTLAAYAETRLKFPFIIGQFGVRMDYLNPNLAIALDNTAIVGGISPAHRSFDTKIAVSPRIGISLPLSDSDFIFFNYGKYSQIPSLYYLYAGTATESEESPFRRLLGNPDLKPTQSINYELSYSKNISPVTSITVTGFYRDFFDLLDSEASRFFSSGNSISSTYINRAFGRARGLEVQVAHSFSPKLHGRAIYTFMKSTGTANSTQENYNEFVRVGFNWNDEVNSLNWDQRHSFIFMADAQIKKFRLNVASRIYSPRQWEEQTTTSITGAKVPFRNLLDLKVKYRAKSGSFKLTPYIEVRNLFNVRYNEYREPLSLFNSQPLIPFQEQFGRRFRVGLQIN